MRNRPFLLKPAAKDYLWGGTRLNDDFNFNINIHPFAEAWVCSTHSDGESVTDNGETLSEILKAHPEYLGSHAEAVAGGEFPILVKLIDAKEDLSLQVHPDDEYARINENGSLGKNEMWYVIDAKPHSSLVYGFRRNVEAEEVRAAINNGRLKKMLNHVKVKPNDLFFIDAGTVHAIGSGCLIAEIQENSNLTYRLYDYERRDKNGNQRALHIDKALEVAKLSSSASPRQPMRVLRYRKGCADELLCRCKYFQVSRLLINALDGISTAFQTESNSFHVLLCIEGNGRLSSDDEAINLDYVKGDCIFVPADSIKLKLCGRAQILDISC